MFFLVFNFSDSVTYQLAKKGSATISLPARKVWSRGVYGARADGIGCGLTPDASGTRAPGPQTPTNKRELRSELGIGNGNKKKDRGKESGRG